MRLIRHPEADEELEHAALWYEKAQPRLGEKFLNNFELTLRRILSDPSRWRLFFGQNRKLNFNRFAYAIIYSVEGDSIYVKAVMDLRRRPGYWRHRA